ncbi:MAG TPA: hypothetical protein VFY61_12400, partial [Pyrinomonadaceae bacterium]|nr:hypothetical protein [Pyrinomonadaceae bacterium]
TAERARRLEPAQPAYAMLVAQIHVARSDAIAARALLEPLTRDSDPRIKTEAQNLLESLNDGAAGNRSRASTRASVSVPLAAEPVAAGPSRMLGEGSSSSAARDGHTIETSGSLPTVDQLLARYVEAMGGAKAINAITSRAIKGTVDVAGLSRGGSFETHTQAPNKSTTVIDAYPFGKVTVGYNGRSGWSQTQQGVQPIKVAAELASLQRDSDIYSVVRVKSNYAKVTLAGTSHIGYREVYVLDLKPAVGAVERLYLDVKTHLPARMNTARKLGAALAPVEVYFDDWQAVDGIKYPFSISQRFDKLTLTFTVKEIRHNVPLDAKIFEPPAK